MIKKVLLLVTLASALILVGCGKSQETTDNTTSSDIQSYSSPSLNKGLVTHPFILTEESSIPCPFVSSGDLIYFPNWNYDSNISSIAKSKIKYSISTSEIADFVNYSTSSLVLVDNTIYFADSSNDNNLSSINFTDKSYQCLVRANVTNLVSVGNILYYINRSDNNYLYSYDTSTKKEHIISKTKVGRYMINGDFILFQNMDDNAKLYKMRLDGTEKSAVSDFSVDSFIVYNNMILTINSSDNNNLYKIDPTTLDSTRLFLMNGENLKYCNNKIYYVNLADANYLYSLTVSLENSVVTSTAIIKDSTNDYYLSTDGIFLEKALNVNNVYYQNY